MRLFAGIQCACWCALSVYWWTLFLWFLLVPKLLVCCYVDLPSLVRVSMFQPNSFGLLLTRGCPWCFSVYSDPFDPKFVSVLFKLLFPSLVWSFLTRDSESYIYIYIFCTSSSPASHHDDDLSIFTTLMKVSSSTSPSFRSMISFNVIITIVIVMALINCHKTHKRRCNLLWTKPTARVRVDMKLYFPIIVFHTVLHYK